MVDQPNTPLYNQGQVVWVKLSRGIWWPGVVEDDPEQENTRLKKPIATVKFFDGEFMDVMKLELIYNYNCMKKEEFIRKGLELSRRRDAPGHMKSFPNDVVRAENLTDGNPNIIYNPEFIIKPIITPSKVSSKSENRVKPNDGDEEDEPNCPNWDSRIRLQKPAEVKGSEIISNGFVCKDCGFQSYRINNVVHHVKSHLRGAVKKSSYKPKTSLSIPSSKDFPTPTKVVKKKVTPKPKKKPVSGTTTEATVKVAKIKRSTPKSRSKPPQESVSDILKDWDEVEDSPDDSNDTTLQEEDKKNETDHPPTASNSSCFDFEEQEDNIPVVEKFGQKLPRVIDENKAKKWDEDLDAGLEEGDKNTKQVAEEMDVVKESEVSNETEVSSKSDDIKKLSVEPNHDVAGTISDEGASREPTDEMELEINDILEKTTVPELPSLPSLPLPVTGNLLEKAPSKPEHPLLNDSYFQDKSPGPRSHDGDQGLVDNSEEGAISQPVHAELPKKESARRKRQTSTDLKEQPAPTRRMTRRSSSIIEPETSKVEEPTSKADPDKQTDDTGNVSSRRRRKTASAESTQPTKYDHSSKKRRVLARFEEEQQPSLEPIQSASPELNTPTNHTESTKSNEELNSETAAVTESVVSEKSCSPAPQPESTEQTVVFNEPAVLDTKPKSAFSPQSRVPSNDIRSWSFDYCEPVQTETPKVETGPIKVIPSPKKETGVVLSPRKPVIDDVVESVCSEPSEPSEVVLEPPKVLEEPPKVEEEPPKVVEKPPKVVEEPPKVSEDPLTVIEKPSRGQEELTKVIEEPLKVIEEPPRASEELLNIVQKPETVLEESPKSLVEPQRALEEPLGDLKEPQVTEEPLKNVEEPQQVVEPLDVLDEPPKIAEEPQDITEGPVNIIEEPPKVIEEDPSKVLEEPQHVVEEPLKVLEPAEPQEEKKEGIIAPHEAIHNVRLEDIPLPDTPMITEETVVTTETVGTEDTNAATKSETPILEAALEASLHRPATETSVPVSEANQVSNENMLVVRMPGSIEQGDAGMNLVNISSNLLEEPAPAQDAQVMVISLPSDGGGQGLSSPWIVCPQTGSTNGAVQAVTPNSSGSWFTFQGSDGSSNGSVVSVVRSETTVANQLTTPVPEEPLDINSMPVVLDSGTEVSDDFKTNRFSLVLSTTPFPESNPPNSITIKHRPKPLIRPNNPLIRPISRQIMPNTSRAQMLLGKTGGFRQLVATTRMNGQPGTPTQVTNTLIKTAEGLTQVPLTRKILKVVKPTPGKMVLSKERVVSTTSVPGVRLPTIPPIRGQKQVVIRAKTPARVTRPAILSNKKTTPLTTSGNRSPMVLHQVAQSVYLVPGEGGNNQILSMVSPGSGQATLAPASTTGGQDILARALADTQLLTSESEALDQSAQASSSEPDVSEFIVLKPGPS